MFEFSRRYIASQKYHDITKYRDIIAWVHVTISNSNIKIKARKTAKRTGENLVVYLIIRKKKKRKKDKLEWNKEKKEEKINLSTDSDSWALCLYFGHSTSKPTLLTLLNRTAYPNSIFISHYLGRGDILVLKKIA